jgi:hypothetical protein
MAGPLTVGLCLMVLSGCGGGGKKLAVVPVKGAIKADGTALAGAQVLFVPKNPSKETLSATGTTDDQGQYTLSAGTYNGVPIGDYNVVVKHFSAIDGKALPAELANNAEQMIAAGRAKSTLPKAYSEPQRTPLSITVSADKSSGYDFDIATKPAKGK